MLILFDLFKCYANKKKQRLLIENHVVIKVNNVVYINNVCKYTVNRKSKNQIKDIEVTNLQKNYFIFAIPQEHCFDLRLAS